MTTTEAIRAAEADEHRASEAVTVKALIIANKVAYRIPVDDRTADDYLLAVAVLEAASSLVHELRLLARSGVAA